MGPRRLGDDRTWSWCGRTVHLITGDHPRLVGAAILAHRDAATEDDEDFAAVLLWTVEEHPPWNGDCPTCGTDGPCETQQAGDGLALDYLIRRTTDLVRCSRERLAGPPSEGAA